MLPLLARITLAVLTRSLRFVGLAAKAVIP
jgi:hypothetical protein